MTDRAENVTAGWRRAHRLYPSSKNHRNTYMRGVAARLDNQPIDACPYPKGGNTWRAGYRLAWLGGFRSIGEDDLG